MKLNRGQRVHGSALIDEFLHPRSIGRIDRWDIQEPMRTSRRDISTWESLSAFGPAPDRISDGNVVVNVNGGTRKSSRRRRNLACEERERESRSERFLDVETPRSTCVAREISRALAEYELAICYGAAFLWHFSLLILLAGGHPPAGSRVQKSRCFALLPAASYYRDCN